MVTLTTRAIFSLRLLLHADLQVFLEFFWRLQDVPVPELTVDDASSTLQGLRRAAMVPTCLCPGAESASDDEDDGTDIWLAGQMGVGQCRARNLAGTSNLAHDQNQVPRWDDSNFWAMIPRLERCGADGCQGTDQQRPT